MCAALGIKGRPAPLGAAGVGPGMEACVRLGYFTGVLGRGKK